MGVPHPLRETSALSRVIRTARRLGVPRLARRLPEHEVEAYAFSLEYMLCARAWLLRRRAPGWRAIEQAWRSSVPEVLPRFSGRLMPSDKIHLLVDGADAFVERERLLASAQRSVDLSTYYFQADATGWSTAHQLADCARRGVRVRVLVDRYMLERKRRETPELAALMAFLRQHAVRVRLWHDPERAFDSNHRKMLLVDNRTALVGGRNFADHYRQNDWRDVDLVVRGPSVAPLCELFEELWSTPAGADIAPRRFTPWFDYRPRLILQDPTAQFVLDCIASARKSIVLELAYLVGPSLLTRTLVSAAQRGVHVWLLTNSEASTDLPYATFAAYAAMRELLAGGVDVSVRRGTGRTLHSKYLVVDNAWVAFGSHNLDYYSSRFCCETTLQVESPELASMLTACFADGVCDSEPVDLQAEVLPFLRSSPGLRFFNWAFRDFQ